jgi:hypothetical protein
MTCFTGGHSLVELKLIWSFLKPVEFVAQAVKTKVLYTILADGQGVVLLLEACL